MFDEAFGNTKTEQFEFDFIEKYFRKKTHKDSFQVISESTCVDLDFKDLFTFLDRTQTPIGQQTLYNRLRVIPTANASLALEEELINKFTKDKSFRNETQLALEHINNSYAYHISDLFQDHHTTPPKWYAVVKLLAATSFLSLIFIWFNPQVFFLLLSVFITNMVIHYWNKKNIMQYTGAIPLLIKLNGVAKELSQTEELKKLAPNISASIKLIAQIKRSMSFFRLDSRLKSEFEILAWLILELIKILFLLEPLLLFGVLKKIDTKRKEIEEVFRFVGAIDSLISIASLRKSAKHYCIPKIDNNRNFFEGVDIFHPLVDDCVKNSIQLNEKSVLLTGSNMSGKTTFIRTVGINTLLAQTINTCFAKQMILPQLQVHSAIRISDDLMNDKSYYFEEVLRIKQLLTESMSEKKQLFLLDEIFKGTNTIERISAGKAVLSKLNNANNFVFVSTHDIELTDLLEKEYELYHFSEIISDDKIDFDYLLKSGHLTKRNAIRILEINDYPKELISEALDISKKMDEIAVNNMFN